jgi:CRP-like cAMP-binding protein
MKSTLKKQQTRGKSITEDTGTHTPIDEFKIAPRPMAKDEGNMSEEEIPDEQGNPIINLNFKDFKSNEVLDPQNEEELKAELNPILYVRNVPSDSFYLILSGNVVVCSGQEGFMIKLGPFNYVGLEALTTANNHVYQPDFSAKVINKARLLRIRRAAYQRILALDRAGAF